MKQASFSWCKKVHYLFFFYRYYYLFSFLFLFFVDIGFDDQGIRAKTEMTWIIIINIYILKYNIREMLFSEWDRRHKVKNPST